MTAMTYWAGSAAVERSAEAFNSETSAATCFSGTTNLDSVDRLLAGVLDALGRVPDDIAWRMGVAEPAEGYGGSLGLTGEVDAENDDCDIERDCEDEAEAPAGAVLRSIIVLRTLRIASWSREDILSLAARNRGSCGRTGLSFGGGRGRGFKDEDEAEEEGVEISSSKEAVRGMGRNGEEGVRRPSFECPIDDEGT